MQLFSEGGKLPATTAFFEKGQTVLTLITKDRFSMTRQRSKRVQNIGLAPSNEIGLWVTPTTPFPVERTRKTVRRFDSAQALFCCWLWTVSLCFVR